MRKKRWRIFRFLGKILGTCCFLILLSASVESKGDGLSTLFYSGKTSYTPSWTNGFFGYSRAKNVPIPPATVSTNDSANPDDIGTNSENIETSPYNNIETKSSFSGTKNFPLLTGNRSSLDSSFGLPLSSQNDSSLDSQSDSRLNSRYSVRPTVAVSQQETASVEAGSSALNASTNSALTGISETLSSTNNFASTQTEAMDQTLLNQSLLNQPALDASFSSAAYTPDDPSSLLPPSGLKTQAELTSSMDSFLVPDTEKYPCGFILTRGRGRQSFFQSIEMQVSNLPNSHLTRCGQSQVNASVSLGLPCPTVRYPLLITPYFSWTQLDLPRSIPQEIGYQQKLYGTGLHAIYLAPICDSLTLNLYGKLLWNTDFHAHGRNILQYSGYAAGIWAMQSRLRIVLGAYYSNIYEYHLLPVGGILWNPSDDFYLEGYFPYPKAGWRLHCLKSEKETVSPYWFYVKGEYDFNRWFIEPQSPVVYGDGTRGDCCRLEYRDVRCVFGLERLTTDEMNWALEAGVAFSRKLELETQNFRVPYSTVVRPDATGMVRLRVSY